MKNIYYKLKPNSLSRRALLQIYLLALALLNFLLNLLPFSSWKKLICICLGVHLGSNVTICSNVRFLSFGKCSIGDRTIINRNCVIDNRCGIEIANDVSISMNVIILTQGHNSEGDDFSLKGNKVIIDHHVCVYANSMIMPGIILSEGCVVYPGSIVTKSFPRNSIVAGHPAICIKDRNSNLSYQLNSNFWFS